MLSNKQQLVLAKLEVTEGTDPVPVKTTDAVLCDNVDPVYAPEQIARRIVQADISDPKIVFGNEIINFSILAELKGSGTAGVAPEIGALLQACGMKEVVVEATSVTYTPNPASEAFKSVTIYLYKGGILWKAVACKGSFVIDCVASEFPQVTFQMSGKLSDILDAACPSDATYNATLPVQVGDAGLSFGAFNNGVVRSISINSGNPVSPRRDVNSAGGLKGYVALRRNPTYSVVVESELEATHPFWGDLRARTEEAIDITVGSTAGNIVTITAPKACSTGIRTADEESMMMYQIEGQALKNSGNDNITIAFT